MREILSRHDLRQLELLEFLVKSKEEWVLLKDISDYLNAPIRTIHSDIKEINTYIHPIHIDASPSGVKISIPANLSERYIYKKILDESLEFRLIEFIFMNEEQTIWSLSEKLHISESTTKRMLKKINKGFENEDFSIGTNPLSLVGDERKITQFMFFYFNEKYLFQEEYMTNHQKELILQLIDSTLDGTGKERYFPNLKRISTRIFLICIRLKNNHDIPISQQKQFHSDVLNNLTFCDDFYKTFGIRLTDKTIRQLFSISSSESYVFNPKEMYDLIKRDSHQKSLYDEIKKILDLLSAELNIPLKQPIEEKLLLDMMNIINIKDAISYNTFILYDQKGYFLSKLSRNYYYVKDMIKKQLMNNLSFDFTENLWNELIYLLLTHWSDLYHKVRYIETPIRVYLLIDTDIEHGLLIKNELETYSRYHIEVEIMKSYSIEELQLLNNDNVLITNIPGIGDLDCATLCFGEFLNNRDWQKFDKLLEKILSHRKTLT